ncbi:hypothetical protein GGX14DRAFT_596185 [Mycena pura]|uniref:Uncharacterized protein n=1 Tax=Mycena pura TaxID=153505 RepID=A0AAD6Y1G1_9AGAR|nr:hypothetical protein GGX14DRAFT_596185 [Mycena pura]
MQYILFARITHPTRGSGTTPVLRRWFHDLFLGHLGVASVLRVGAGAKLAAPGPDTRVNLVAVEVKADCAALFRPGRSHDRRCTCRSERHRRARSSAAPPFVAPGVGRRSIGLKGRELGNERKGKQRTTDLDAVARRYRIPAVQGAVRRGLVWPMVLRVSEESTEEFYTRDTLTSLLKAPPSDVLAYAGGDMLKPEDCLCVSSGAGSTILKSKDYVHEPLRRRTVSLCRKSAQGAYLELEDTRANAYACGGRWWRVADQNKHDMMLRCRQRGVSYGRSWAIFEIRLAESQSEEAA